MIHFGREVMPGTDGAVVTAADSADVQLERLGRLVAWRRTELGLSQRALAAQAGVALGTATRLERGQGFPRLSNVLKIESALQWPRGTMQHVLDGGDPPESTPGERGRRPAGDLAAASQGALTLSVAAALVGVAEVCMAILAESPDTDNRSSALSALDKQLRELEVVIAAGLPDTDAFDNAVAVLADVHRNRDAIREAAAKTEDQ